MNLKITPAQAAILYRLLSEDSVADATGRGTTIGNAMRDDLASDDVWSLWDQLDDLMGERGIPRQSYREVAEAQKQREPEAMANA